MKKFIAYLPFSEIKGKKDTGRNINAKNINQARKEAVSIYGASVKVIEEYDPHWPEKLHP